MTGKAWRWIVVLVFVVSVLIALRLIGPAVPNEIRMLTGPEDSTFYADALRYKVILSRHGVTVHLEQTSGSVENLADLNRLQDLSGAKIEAGEERSDSLLLALFLLQEEGIGDEVEFAQTDALTPDQALGAIQNHIARTAPIYP